jgi:elongation factor Ts
MTITASLVKELRERTGAGMMECKKALVEVDGDLEAAQELLRKIGQASAIKKSGRIAAEGRIALATSKAAAVIVEVNCETDFVAKDDNFLGFARQVADMALEHSPADLDTLMALQLPSGESLEEARNTLVAKIDEKIKVRRFEAIQVRGAIGSYLHGARIGVLVDVEGGDEALRKDLAMHIAASSPSRISAEDVPADEVEKERKFLSEQAAQEGKPPEIVAKMIDGRLRKYLNEITLLGQPFVKDTDINIGKLLQQADATVHSFVRLEVGEGIEKKVENFAEEVQAQVNAQS